VSNGNLYYIDLDKARKALANAALLEREYANLYQIVCQGLARWDGKQITARIRNDLHGKLPQGMSINLTGRTLNIWRQGGDVQPDYTNRFRFELEQNPDTQMFDYARTLGGHGAQHYAGCSKRLTDAALLAEKLEEHLAKYNAGMKAMREASDALGYFKGYIIDQGNRSTWSGL
jgi:hypothetical protein